MSKQLLEVIFHGYGINVTLPLKVICKDVIVLKRILEILTPFSQLFQDYIVSEINQCINEISTSQWQVFVQQCLGLRRSIRGRVEPLKRELLAALNLSEEESQRTRTTTVGHQILTLDVSRGFEAFQNLSAESKKFIVKVAIYRCKQMLNVEIDQLTQCAEEMFDAETKELLLQTANEGTELVQQTTYESMFESTDETTEKTTKICESLDRIRSKIKETAYSKGWNAITFFRPQTH